MLALIMAGGVGQRFWPLSRRTRPKQLLDLTGRGAMIRLTVDRLRGLSSPEEVLVITNEEQLRGIRQELPELPAGNIIGEPRGRNTAVCIGIGALVLKERFGNRPVLVLPADHLIGKEEVFHKVVRIAESYASINDELITFGIPPSHPETGYGYILAGEEIYREGAIPIYRTKEFIEKPDRRRAGELLRRGRVFWNSGIFLWRPDVILAAISRHLPDLAHLLEELAGAVGTDAFTSVFNDVYRRAPSVSIDYGVLEKEQKVAVVKAEFPWSDLGSWESIRMLHAEDESGNVLVGRHVVVGGRGNTVFSPEKTVALVGVEDLIVVCAPDAVLVCRRSRAQEVRRVVEALRQRGDEDIL